MVKAAAVNELNFFTMKLGIFISFMFVYGAYHFNLPSNIFFFLILFICFCTDAENKLRTFFISIYTNYLIKWTEGTRFKKYLKHCPFYNVIDTCFEWDGYEIGAKCLRN